MPRKNSYHGFKNRDCQHLLHKLLMRVFLRTIGRPTPGLQLDGLAWAPFGQDSLDHPTSPAIEQMVISLASGTQRIDHGRTVTTTLGVVLQGNTGKDVPDSRGPHRDLMSRQATIQRSLQNPFA
jgi:hypothetical protein